MHPQGGDDIYEGVLNKLRRKQNHAFAQRNPICANLRLCRFPTGASAEQLFVRAVGEVGAIK